MKTLILYATKHGAARQIAQRIAGMMQDAELCDLKQAGIPSLESYDSVIIGSSLYAGMIRKETKAFLRLNGDKLLGKRLGLFVSGLDGSGEKRYFETNFPQDILQAAVEKRFLGGIFDPKKAGVMGRLIMRMVTKQAVYTDTISDDAVKRFAAAFQ